VEGASEMGVEVGLSVNPAKVGALLVGLLEGGLVTGVPVT
jgi:hypothetical protein